MEEMAGFLPCQIPSAYFSSLRKTTADLSPSFHPHSSLSIYLLGASWAFLVSVGAAT